MSYREKLLKQQEILKRYGVSCDNGREIAGIMSESGKVMPFVGQTVFDSQTPPSGTSGIAFHYYLDPKTIKVLKQPLNVVEAFGREVSVGSWATETWVKSITEQVGDTQPYSDYTSGRKANSNRNYFTRKGYRHEASMMYGELETEIASAQAYNIISEEREAQMYALNAANNRIAAYGVQDQETYGVLNDPNLRTAIVAPKSWATATFEEIKVDIFKMITDLINASGENVTMESEFVMTISGETWAVLSASNNDFGKSLIERLKEAIPNISYKTVPQFKQTTGNIAELRAVDVVGDRVWEFGFGQKLRLHKYVQYTSHAEQKASSQTFGAILNYPIFVSRMTGV